VITLKHIACVKVFLLTCEQSVALAQGAAVLQQRESSGHQTITWWHLKQLRWKRWDSQSKNQGIFRNVLWSLKARMPKQPSKETGQAIHY